MAGGCRPLGGFRLLARKIPVGLKVGVFSPPTPIPVTSDQVGVLGQVQSPQTNDFLNGADTTKAPQSPTVGPPAFQLATLRTPSPPRSLLSAWLFQAGTLDDKPVGSPLHDGSAKPQGGQCQGGGRRRPWWPPFHVTERLVCAQRVCEGPRPLHGLRGGAEVSGVGESNRHDSVSFKIGRFERQK